MSSEPTFATAAPRRAGDSDFAWASPRAGRLVYIDGLCAIAIVAFHARIPGFQGGFVGVDIFFVISGFLITHQIVSQTLAGNFSIDRRRVEQRRRAKPSPHSVVPRPRFRMSG